MAENRSVCESCRSIGLVVTKEATVKGLFVGESPTYLAFKAGQVLLELVPPDHGWI